MAKLLNVVVTTAIVGTALYAAAGYFAVPYLVKMSLERGVAHSLNRQIQIQKVTFDPWSGLLEIRQLQIAGLSAEQPALINVPFLRLDLSAQTVRHFAPVFDEITVDGLTAEVAMSDPDIRNLVENKTNGTPDTQERSAPHKGLPNFAFYNINVKNAMVHVTDKANGLDQSITNFNLSLPFVSTLPGAQESLLTPSLSFDLNGSTIYATGSTKPFGTTLEARLNFKVKDLDITPLTKLVPSLNTPSLQLQTGKLSSDLTFVFRNPTGGNPGRLFVNGTAQLRNIQTNQTNGNRTDKLLSIGNASVKIKQIDFIERSAEIDALSIDRALLNIVVGAPGVINNPSSTTPSATTASNAPTASSTWRWSLGNFEVTNSEVDIVNTALRKEPQISLASVNVAVSGLSSDAQADKAQLNAKGQLLGGTITAKGQLAGQTFDGDIDTSIKQVNLSQLNAFLPSYVRGNLAGTFNGALKLTLKGSDPTLSGVLDMAGFTVKQGRETTFALKTLTTQIKTFAPSRNELTLGEVKLTEPNLSLTKYRSGWNVESLFSPLLKTNTTSEATTAPSAGTASGSANAQSTDQTSAWKWLVESFIIDNGTLRYADQTTRPNFVLTQSAIALKANQLSLDRKGTYTLAMNVAQGKLESQGELDLAAETIQASLSATNIQLRDLNTLIMQAAGVGTRSGTLNTKGDLLYILSEPPHIGYKGNLNVTNMTLVNNRNSPIASWNDARLEGMDFVQKDGQPKVLIAKATLDQPKTKETGVIQEVASFASLIARATGHERTAERLQKVDNKLNAQLVLENVRFENGKFSAKGLDANSVAGKVLEKLGENLNKK